MYLQRLVVAIQFTKVGGRILLFQASRRAERHGDLYGNRKPAVAERQQGFLSQ
jgi:hypothetical protein